ncbi:MAG: YidC/Oxa1 family membrane protein insertase [Candidatus Adlerbacteria bacterium]
MFNTFLINPIYNAFIYLIGIMPQGDVGLAIIAMTLLIRIVFYPLFASNIRTQMGMQAAQVELNEINKKYKDNADERAKRTMELFKQHKVRPLSAFFALLVQIPVFLALYYAFFREDLPKIATELLYSFVSVPTVVSTNFFGLIDLLLKHNVVLALAVAFLQYAVIKLSLFRTVSSAGSVDPQKEMSQKLQQGMMLYFLPGLMGVVSYTLPAAVGIYFAAGSVISLGQEWIIQRQMQKK